ncbi:hypothetical protein N9A89_02370 [Akkermansiaceae bacterium]|nr:hypothetical protein [Akkermansiaceae bacterium]MDA7935731.1 hypothetical protein [bacterium]MDA7518810.1 hypothetical protein [Akkermansiaceae bacterium]MDA7629723.1 hypothetical protein [Akkermansiaceae bacterium]MDA7862561.1 hypothetical protein [Akkermansiaceae bacterium]
MADGFLTLTFERPLDRADVNYQAQLSDTLNIGGWSPLTLEVMSQTSTTETVRAQIAIPASGNKLFIRLRLELQ